MVSDDSRVDFPLAALKAASLESLDPVDPLKLDVPIEGMPTGLGVREFCCESCCFPDAAFFFKQSLSNIDIELGVSDLLLSTELAEFCLPINPGPLDILVFAKAANFDS